MANTIFGIYHTNEDIRDYPLLRMEQGIPVISLPDGKEAFVAPRYSENGNGWWTTTYEGEEIQEMYLFETLSEALAELSGEN